MKIFPPLYDIGTHMMNNYGAWADRRKKELVAEGKLAAPALEEECQKLEDRKNKFKEKMSFIADLTALCAKSIGAQSRETTGGNYVVGINSTSDKESANEPPQIVRKAKRMSVSVSSAHKS